MTDSKFTEMPKGRISDIVDKSRTFENIRAVFADKLVDFGSFRVNQPTENRVPERARKGTHLKRVSEPCADKITAIKRINLSLVLKPPKRRASDYTVIVLAEFRADIKRVCGDI